MNKAFVWRYHCVISFHLFTSDITGSDPVCNLLWEQKRYFLPGILTSYPPPCWLAGWQRVGGPPSCIERCCCLCSKKIIMYINWVFNTPMADRKNFRWYLKDSHRFYGSMAPLTPDLFLSCCISREKVFRGNGVTFREAGGRVRLCKLPSDAIATLQPHLSRKYAREEKICPRRKKCPRR